MHWYHFSIDDVFDSLIEVTDQRIPLFTHPFFADLQQIHTEFGAHVSLYLFFQKEIGGRLRNLAEVRDLRNEISAAGEWIGFGPHALDFATDPYAQTPAKQITVFDRAYTEIDRFAGKGAHARWVRLHHYSESYELANYFNQKGVTALFTTDRAAGSYRMPDYVRQQLLSKGFAEHEGMDFIRTQFRVEFFANDGLDKMAIEKLFRDALARYGRVVFYSHEDELIRPEVRTLLHTSMDILRRLGVPDMQHNEHDGRNCHESCFCPLPGVGVQDI